MRCKDCKFFAACTGALGKIQRGECRANPPVVQTDSSIPRWPLVHEGEFCGRFTAR
jgi:hypothetical protein